MPKPAADRPRQESRTFGRAERDIVALGIGVAALIMFVGTGGSLMPKIVRAWLGTGSAPDVLLTNAVLLNIALGFGQEFVRSAIWNFWQTSAASQFTKNLIYFCFIFSFAMLRLWLTLTVLTLGLRQSYVRAD